MPGTDVERDLFVAQVGFTDSNKDGKAEVTVPYRLFCGGAIEPSTVKVILREGSTKLAICGESMVQVQHHRVEALGDEHTHDAPLLTPERALYKRDTWTLYGRESPLKSASNACLTRLFLPSLLIPAPQDVLTYWELGEGQVLARMRIFPCEPSLACDAPE